MEVNSTQQKFQVSS